MTSVSDAEAVIRNLELLLDEARDWERQDKRTIQQLARELRELRDRVHQVEQLPPGVQSDHDG